MKGIAVLLIAVGIAGLITTAIIPTIVGFAGFIGSLALLLTGIGFFIRCCFTWKK